MANNNALARFITSLGSLNHYDSTVYQTKRALDLGATSPLRQDADDIALFKGAVRKVRFSVDGIIAVNQQFNSQSDEDPNRPGHLRNAAGPGSCLPNWQNYNLFKMAINAPH